MLHGMGHGTWHITWYLAWCMPIMDVRLYIIYNSCCWRCSIHTLLDGSAAGQPLLHDIHFLHCCAEHTHKAPLALVAIEVDIDKHMQQQSSAGFRMTHLDDSNMVARHVRDGAAQNVPGAEACLAVNGWVEESAGIGIRYVHAGPRFCHPAGNPHPKGHPDHLPVLFRICNSSPATHHDMRSCNNQSINLHFLSSEIIRGVNRQ